MINVAILHCRSARGGYNRRYMSLRCNAFDVAEPRQRPPAQQGPIQPMPTLTFAGAELARTELDRLQGVWTSIDGRHDVELLVAGSLFTVKFLDGKIYMGTLTLDATEQPREMLMRIDEGPIKHKGKF